MPHPSPARRATAVLAALAAVGAAVLTGSSATAAPAPSAPLPPVIAEDFPDPDVLQISRVYHAYGTGGGGTNLRHATSPDMRTWTPRPDLAPQLGAWVDPDCTASGRTMTNTCVWAPEVSVVLGGTFTLYYTARSLATGRQCIGVSTAPTPEGPFTPVGPDPLVCPEGTGAIDPATFDDDDGQRYLLWKADGNCCGQPTVINLQPLSADGLTLTGPATELVRNDQVFEGRVVEAPTLIERDGRYVLFYSAGDYAGSRYGTAHATSDSVAGPYAKGGLVLRTRIFDGALFGPGGQDVVTFGDASTRIAFHGWDAGFTRRALHVRGLRWDGGVPTVDVASPY